MNKTEARCGNSYVNSPTLEEDDRNHCRVQKRVTSPFYEYRKIDRTVEAKQNESRLIRRRENGDNAI